MDFGNTTKDSSFELLMKFIKQHAFFFWGLQATSSGRGTVWLNVSTLPNQFCFVAGPVTIGFNYKKVLR